MGQMWVHPSWGLGKVVDFFCIVDCPSALTIQEPRPHLQVLGSVIISLMGVFHYGMNHWQRQWLSDRLHKRNDDPPMVRIPIEKPLKPIKPKRQATKAKKTAKNPLKGSADN
jgi:hypothetical protein